MPRKKLQDTALRFADDNWPALCLAARTGFIKSGPGITRVFVPKRTPKSFEPKFVYFAESELLEQAKRLDITNRELADELRWMAEEAGKYDPDVEVLFSFGYFPGGSEGVMLRITGTPSPKEIDSQITKLRLVK